MTNTQDILFIVLAVAVLWITAFLCWALYEIAKLVHQANAMVTETREKISRVEKIAMMIKDKLEHSVNYLGLMAEGGKALLSFFQQKEEKKEKRIGKKKSELFDEEEGE